MKVSWQIVSPCLYEAGLYSCSLSIKHLISKKTKKLCKWACCLDQYKIECSTPVNGSLIWLDLMASNMSDGIRVRNYFPNVGKSQLYFMVVVYWRHSCYNSYHHRKCTQLPEFNPLARLFAFHIILIKLLRKILVWFGLVLWHINLCMRKIWIQLFSWSLHGIVANVLDCDILMSKFKL